MILISCFCPVKPQPSSISMAPLGTASCTPVGGLQPCTVSLHRRQLPRASVDGHRTDLKRYGCTLLPGWKACVGSFSMENYECSAEDPFYSCRVLLTPTRQIRILLQLPEAGCTLLHFGDWHYQHPLIAVGVSVWDPILNVWELQHLGLQSRWGAGFRV